MIAGFIAMTPAGHPSNGFGRGVPTQALWISFAIMDALLGVLVL
jgi:hypothetical protein